MSNINTYEMLVAFLFLGISLFSPRRLEN